MFPYPLPEKFFAFVSGILLHPELGDGVARLNF
jgi:hypothetical protein